MTCRRVAVFCSATDDLSPLFYSESELIGEALASDGHEVIFGGAASGCMGALARGVRRKNGRLLGIIPQLESANDVHDGAYERRVVPTIADRKSMMLELADVFVVFPGGLGTLDEALDVLALKGSGSLQKPLIFYNFLGVWTPFLEALELLGHQRLIRQPLASLFGVLDKPEALRENLKHVLRTS